MSDSTRLILRDADVEEFARTSGDVNPLHTDAEFSRRTPYGRPIAHGALVVIAALRVLPAERFSGLTVLNARFAGPVVTGATYELACSAPRRVPSGSRSTVTVSEGGTQLMTITVDSACAEGEDPGPGLPLPAPEPGTELAAPEIRTIAQVDAGLTLTGPYRVPAPDGLRALADRLGSAAVPDGLLAALSWASYYVGMRIPGRDALFSSLKIKTTDIRTAPAAVSDAAPRYEAVTRSVDPLSGGIATEIAVRSGGAALTMEIFAFMRPTVPPITRASVARFLPESGRLAGTHVLVVGGSRGIGAAICAALATQGATVWAGHTRPSEPFAALRAEFGPDRVRALALDATDPASLERAARELGRELDSAGAALGGLVLSAGPSVPNLALHPDTAQRTLDFVGASVAMMLHPLAHLAGRVAKDGWMVAVSSSAVEDTPRQWPHYVTAKHAVEGLVTHHARNTGLRTLIARAPKMWTEMSNGPTAQVDTVPAEQVAAAIVDWVLDGADPAGAAGSNPLVRSSAELAAWQGRVAA